jgi:hypothetical protein
MSERMSTWTRGYPMLSQLAITVLGNMYSLHLGLDMDNEELKTNYSDYLNVVESVKVEDLLAVLEDEQIGLNEKALNILLKEIDDEFTQCKNKDEIYVDFAYYNAY